MKRVVVLATLCLGLVAAPWATASLLADDAPSASDTEPSAKFKTVTLRGQIVWLAEALERRFGIATDEDAAHAAVALETTDGELVPLAKDVRGRGFHLDPRLRGLDLELLVRRYDGSPVVQVIRVYTRRPDGRYELDYWCDICSIPMYELKPCECCQGESRLRERKVDAAGNVLDGE
ncbi:MAG: hypothetical protein KF708_14320 [Pirellulales bacterium]|nr:hypothetical protein [Pirellulales bacterium]